MNLLIRLFIKLLTLPRHITLSGVIHLIFVIAGVGTLYLLTLRKTEEGRLEDYLRRVWKRISLLRNRALGFHLAFIKVTAGALTTLLDRIFGHKLISLQSIGVSVAFALFSANLYYLIGGIRRKEAFEHLVDVLITLTLALTPVFIGRTFTPGCVTEETNSKFRQLRCPFMFRRPDHNQVEAGLITLAELNNFPCLCTSTWTIIWFALLVFYVYTEYFSLLFCITCFPSVLRGFLLVLALIIIAIAIFASLLFTLFTIVTRFSLKKLAASDSATKSFLLLLIGFLPLPVFVLLFDLVIFVMNHGLDTSTPGAQKISGREWVIISAFVVLMVTFFINTLFLLAPVLFFSMAMLLLAHRLIWPIIERPIDKLNRIGLTKHPWAIASIAAILIAFGLGGLEAVIKLLKFLGHSTS